ncbi:glycosyltransferase family 4 protein [Thermococcus paralvinellae]|uniref:Glycosyl transferase family protein 13 n=1 Tax=Thermococcus paralvinellae TaxID=582419 RepID=W0IAE1_9EURY|nr:glycosyltransferase family 4 protein [Thermococcus paralvinellae]AHF81408.1 glycosyl transferase family protein 13 [Thermococcus paralvinellae]
MSNYNPHIIFIPPGLVEVGSNRGAGAEVSYYLVALGLSRKYQVVFLTPCYREKCKEKGNIIKINDNFLIHQISIPAVKRYPPQTKVEYFWMAMLTIISSFLIAFEILRYIKRSSDSKLLVIPRVETGIIPLFLLSFVNSKKKFRILYAEGNIRPWYSPYLGRYNNPIVEKVRGIIEKLELIYHVYVGHKANMIRSQSTLIRESMKRAGIPLEKIKVIEPPVEDDLFCKITTRKKTNDKLKVAFIGRLTEEKNAPLIMYICEKSLERFNDKIQFYIFGDGPYRKFLEKLSNVVHVGSVKRDVLLKQLLPNMDIVISFQLELGRAEIESLALGKVVIIPETKETSRVIKNLRNGILITTIDSSSYIEAISLIIINPKVYRKISKLSKTRAFRNFSIDNVAKKWERLLKTMF